MSANNGNKPDTIPEWTVMFYFASDNPLAPSILSQLKSIQQAGFHQEVNVIAQYDPQGERTPLHVFDVNKVYKVQAANTDEPNQIGLRSDVAFVPNLVLDKLWIEAENIEIVRKEIRKKFYTEYEQPAPPGSEKRKSKSDTRTGEPGPKESLTDFLEYCRKHYEAKHYMLFILGHGVVVGNDVFLLDEHGAEHSLSLRDLGSVLREFRTNIGEKQQFECVSFHSCSMNALEVGFELQGEFERQGNFELQGTANYMLGSQGPAFVGSYPYRQILMRIFQDVEDKQTDVKKTLEDIFAYCFHNSRDFQLAGYSFDLCLCDLNKLPNLTASLKKLTGMLIKQVANPTVQACILLAHLDAQSYWGESYCDLYDFCFRLNQRCESIKGIAKETNGNILRLQQACCAVMKQLEPARDNIIIRSGFTGSDFQYSHGFSVFFPWSEPEHGVFWPGEYQKYKFTEEAKTKWFDFLVKYFKETMRDPRGSEIQPKTETQRKTTPKPPETIEILLDNMSLSGVSGEDQLDGPVPGGGGDKGGGSDVTGGGVSLSIKNYPPNTLGPRTKKRTYEPRYVCKE